MPSHQMSPSSVFAQLVKIELRSIVLDRVRVGVIARPRRHAEEAVLGVDRVQPPILAELHPGDVIADRLHRPALERRDQHRQVRLTARARERAGDVLDLALWRSQLEDQHVLGHPALVARHHRGDSQREALLAQQRVTAVARAVGDDLARLGEVDDVLVIRITRPRHVLDAVRIRVKASPRNAGRARTRLRRRARPARPDPCAS